eukprot:2581877-Rhodomonas_salina.1
MLNPSTLDLKIPKLKARPGDAYRDLAGPSKRRNQIRESRVQEQTAWRLWRLGYRFSSVSSSPLFFTRLFRGCYSPVRKNHHHLHACPLTLPFVSRSNAHQRSSLTTNCAEKTLSCRCDIAVWVQSVLVPLRYSDL